MQKEQVSMTTVSVLKFPTAEGAAKMLSPLQRLQEHRLIQIEDTAIVSWPLGAAQPTIRQISDLAGGPGVLNGAFWGMLFGLVFSLPLADAMAGPAVGILTGYL